MNHDGLKKRIEKLEVENEPLMSEQGKAIDKLLRENREYLEHPERFPPEDPEETRAMIKELLQSQCQKARGKYQEATNHIAQ